jgi:hypothetical protein
MQFSSSRVQSGSQFEPKEAIVVVFLGINGRMGSGVEMLEIRHGEAGPKVCPLPA